MRCALSIAAGQRLAGQLWICESNAFEWHGFAVGRLIQL